MATTRLGLIGVPWRPYGAFAAKTAVVVALTADWYKCADAIKDLIVAMAIAEFTADTVVIRKQAWDRPSLSTGGVILSDGRNSRVTAANLKDETGHAVTVTALIGSNQENDNLTELQQLLTWRETLRNGLIGKSLASGLAYDTTIVPGVVVMPGAFEGMFDATQLTVMCKVRD